MERGTKVRIDPSLTNGDWPDYYPIASKGPHEEVEGIYIEQGVSGRYLVYIPEWDDTRMGFEGSTGMDYMLKRKETDGFLRGLGYLKDHSSSFWWISERAFKPLDLPALADYE